MKTREELEKMFDQQDFYEFDLFDENPEIDLCKVKQYIFDEIIPEILKSILPEWNKQTYISTYKNYIKPKAKELYDINL